MNGLDISLLIKSETPLDSARVAGELGFIAVPIMRGLERRPAAKWSDPNYKPTVSDLPRLFTPDRNIAFICGSRSLGLVDADIDSPFAIPFGVDLFPDSPSFGRASNPHSHFQVQCFGAKTKKYEAPKKAANDPPWKGAHGPVLVESQADGKLVTPPPSIHPSGEPYTWHEGRTVAPTISTATLDLRLATLAFMGVFSAYYPSTGGRHDACLAATGLLVTAGHSGEFADDLVRKAARINGDEEWRSRGGGVSAEQRLERGEPVRGIKGFLATMGLPSCWKRPLRDWFFPAEPDQLVIDTGAPRDTAREMIKRLFQTADGQTLVLYQDVFHRFGDGCWRALDEAEVRRIAYDFLETGVVDVGRGETSPLKPTPPLVSALLDATESVALTPRGGLPLWLDDRVDPPAGEVLSFTNGNLHALGQTLTPPTPQLFSLNQIPQAYNPAAPRPATFTAWLQSLWPDCPKTVGLVQEIMGLCLTSDTSFHALFMLYGPPRAGKGVLTNIMQAMMGPRCYCSPSLASLGDGFGLQPLIGKSVAFVPDARLDMSARRSGVTQTLLAISGEDSQTIARKFKGPWEGKLSTRFVISANELPSLRDDAGALTARFVPVVFAQSFRGRENRSLTEGLLKELPGITLWALEGYRRLKKRGHFDLPDTSIDLLSRMSVVFSPLGSFFEDCLIEEEGKETTFGLLYATYQRWAEDQGLRQILSQGQLGERLNDRGFRQVQRRPEKVRARSGLRLNDEWAKRMNSV